MHPASTPRTTPPTSDPAAHTFEAHRDRLWRIAYGILASPEDADDLVQEAYLRWHRTDQGSVRQPEAWLVTTITRLGVDRLRTRQVERKVYVGPWLPTPVVADPAPPPDRPAEIASELSLAFLLLLEKLAPEERAAFLLHDVFDVPYPDIARVLDRTEAASRQMVHRARSRVRGDGTRFRGSPEELERLAARFTAAVAANDYEALLEILAPDASYTTDGGGKVWAARRIVRTADRVARCLLGVVRKTRRTGLMEERIVHVNGEPGVLTLRNGRVVAVTTFAVEDGRIRGLFRMVNPDKLRRIGPLATDRSVTSPASIRHQTSP